MAPMALKPRSLAVRGACNVAAYSALSPWPEGWQVTSCNTVHEADAPPHQTMRPYYSFAIAYSFSLQLCHCIHKGCLHVSCA